MVAAAFELLEEVDDWHQLVQMCRREAHALQLGLESNHPHACLIVLETARPQVGEGFVHLAELRHVPLEVFVIEWGEPERLP